MTTMNSISTHHNPTTISTLVHFNLQLLASLQCDHLQVILDQSQPPYFQLGSTSYLVSRNHIRGKGTFSEVNHVGTCGGIEIQATTIFIRTVCPEDDLKISLQHPSQSGLERLGVLIVFSSTTTHTTRLARISTNDVFSFDHLNLQLLASLQCDHLQVILDQSQPPYFQLGSTSYLVSRNHIRGKGTFSEVNHVGTCGGIEIQATTIFIRTVCPEDDLKISLQHPSQSGLERLGVLIVFSSTTTHTTRLARISTNDVFSFDHLNLQLLASLQCDHLQVILDQSQQLYLPDSKRSLRFLAVSSNVLVCLVFGT